ncbi:hypothetical protein BJ322DRAFT_136799 [Thelephora terrestris]|nr:hypothetical protein BJ322DRAFT_136799 [Thelephora terrestris]
MWLLGTSTFTDPCPPYRSEGDCFLSSAAAEPRDVHVMLLAIRNGQSHSATASPSQFSKKHQVFRARLPNLMEKTQIFDGQVAAGHPINSGPSSRTFKRIRFTDVVTRDVHVYRFMPSSQERGRRLRISSTAAEPRDVPVMLLVIINGPLTSRSAIEDAKESVAEERTSQYIPQRSLIRSSVTLAIRLLRLLELPEDSARSC